MVPPSIDIERFFFFFFFDCHFFSSAVRDGDDKTIGYVDESTE